MAFAPASAELRRARSLTATRAGVSLADGVPASYWENRYASRSKGEATDRVDDRGDGWLCAYAGPFQDVLLKVTEENRSARILNIGCGVDHLSEDVYKDGYTNLISSDVSVSAVEEMKEKTAASMPEAVWIVDDALDMTIESQSVDVVLDKSTLDAIMVRPDPLTSGMLLLKEVQRVLRVGGTYLLATGGTRYRASMLAMPHLAMDVCASTDLGGYFLFVCRKLEEPPAEKLAASWDQALAWAAEQDRLKKKTKKTSISL